MKLVIVLQNALALEAAFELILRSNAEAASQEPPLPPSLLAVIQTGLDGTVGQESPNRVWAASPALPAGLGTQHLQYFAGLSSTLFRLRRFTAGIALLRASAHILSMESACKDVAYRSLYCCVASTGEPANADVVNVSVLVCRTCQ